MELDKCIIGRRAVRNFRDKDVSFKLVNDCLNAARHAPSAGNSQSWKFIVVRDKETKNRIVGLCEAHEWMSSAPVLVVACADLHKIGKYYGARGEALYAVQNLAAAIQNMLLKAYDLGMSSCWVGNFDEESLIRMLNIPSDARPQAIVCLGYSNEEVEPTGREPLDNFVFFESWGKREDKSRGVWPLGSRLDKMAGKLHEKVSRKKN